MLKRKKQRASADEGDQGGFSRRLGWLRMSGRTLTLALLLGAGTAAIAFNAIVLQTQKHPAPLFAAVEAARAVQAKAPRSEAVAPLQAERKPAAEKPVADKASAEKPAAPRMAAAPEKSADDRQATKALAERSAEKSAEKTADKSAQAKPKPVAEAQPLRPRNSDPLADLIRGGIVPPAAIPDEADPRLLTVQKNLARLGYSVGRPDGLMGPGTRAAIEKFEKDRKWQVTGEMSPRLVRELGTVSAGNRN